MDRDRNRNSPSDQAPRANSNASSSGSSVHSSNSSISLANDHDGSNIQQMMMSDAAYFFNANTTSSSSTPSSAAAASSTTPASNPIPIISNSNSNSSSNISGISNYYGQDSPSLSTATVHAPSSSPMRADSPSMHYHRPPRNNSGPPSIHNGRSVSRQGMLATPPAQPSDQNGGLSLNILQQASSSSSSLPSLNSPSTAAKNLNLDAAAAGRKGSTRYYESRRRYPSDNPFASADDASSIDFGSTATPTTTHTMSDLGDDASSFLDTSSLDFAKHSLMVEHLYKALRAKGWLDAEGDEGAVSLRVNMGRIQAPPHKPGMRQQQLAQSSMDLDRRGSVDTYGNSAGGGSNAAPSIRSFKSFQGGAGGPLFVTYPEPNSEFTRAVRGLNVEVAVMLTSKMIRTAIQMVPDQNNDLKLRDGTKLQVLEQLSRLPRGRKLQYAALCRQEGCLVVWSQSIDTIIDAAQAAQDQLIKVVWSGLPQPIEDDEDETTDVGGEGADVEKDGAVGGTIERRKKKYGRTRPIYFIWPLISTLSICVTILFFGFGVSVLVKESMIDGKWYRMAMIGLLPLQILFTQFVPQAAISCIMQIIGPIKQLESNSQYYSGIPPKRIVRGNLPHITIQMPVYTESLDGVLDPTIQSLQKCISTYESQGGSASIFVNEDGMQVISEPEAELRRRYYADHNIGWVSRPKHNHNGFIRKGRFKKASNMNFCLMISRNLEEMLDQNPDLEYDEALERVLAADGRAWAAGDIQLGDLILIVDSDTRVPEDCLLDAASEFMESPEVAILQHQAAPMLVTFNFFEQGIAFFTKIIYASIRYCCASGETSPFVGHNAFLRWSAIKEVAFEEDGQLKYWSESHVSEDFDMSLRLQIKGYCIRYASYCGEGFQEGVSLTVYDEVGRWQKYAYGCSELVFHPLKDMFCKGFFTPLFWRFLGSNMNLYSKINIIGYIGSYYAIGAAWILTLLNYFLIGFWDDEVDSYYLPSFDVLVTTIAVFTVLSNLSFAVFRYRLREKNFFWALWENICWMPFFAVFFSGLSFHVSLALVSHLIGYNMTWGTTAKELDASNFFKEVPKVLGGYKRMYIIFLLLTIMLPIMVYVPPLEWTITGVTLIVPAVLVFGGHLLLPIALNPSLMTFSF
ncbi:hypothetical protein HDU97_009225 [Phlyctochytrium planicorne]|nr:hypothetical protein HDU97_009225 [Phlyctochytrium planicorne]